MSKITPKVMQTKANAIGDTYARLEQDIFKALIKAIDISDLTQENALLWQVQQLDKMGVLSQDVIKLLADTNHVAQSQIMDLIQTSGHQVVTEVDQELQKVLHKQVKVGSGTQDVINSIQRQTFRDLNNSVNQTLLTTNYPNNAAMRTYQEIVKQTMLEVSTGLKTPEQAFRSTVYKWVGKGIQTPLVDKGGHHWSLEVYARTVINSTGHRVFNDLRLKRMDDYGLTTAVMSSHPAARQACAPIQGSVVNIKPKGSPNYDDSYPTIYDYGYGEPQGTQGINCSHTLTPFDPETMTNPYPQYDVDEAMHKSDEQAKQRQMERSIRKNKKLLAAAKELGDEPAIQAYKSRISNHQAKLREFLSDKPYLGRDYSREQINSPDNLAKKKIFDQRKKWSDDYDNFVQQFGPHSIPSKEETIKIRYNGGYRAKLLRNYMNDRQSLIVAPLADYDLYLELYHRAQSKLFGKRTKDNIEIRDGSGHFIARIIGTPDEKGNPKMRREGVPIENVLYTLQNGVIESSTYDSTVQVYISKYAKVAFNKVTGNIVQASPRKRG